ncbi:MAG: transglycosylase domain-containing protein [Desulfobacterales bacterium]|nr:transglycosylase domain-containing protein [Desulfobacterales bacterium]
MLIVNLEAAAAALPSYQEVRAAYRPSDSILLDRSGQVLHELRTDPSVRRLSWTNIGEVSPALQAAVVRAEDKRFREHSGVDWRALAGAAVQGLLSGQWRGASTISMQLAAMLDGGPPPGGRRSLLRKWRQVAAARALEAAWGKDQILEAYLNLVYFRGEHQGVAAAARHLFGKEPHGLDAVESAVLAALIRSPNAPPARIEARALRLARSLGGPAADADVRAAVYRALQPAGGAAPPRAELAAHAARRILKGRRDAAAVHCTLDAGLQSFAGERLAHHLSPLKERRVLEGAVLVADNATGEVRAYATATADPARSRFVDGVTAKRQAGSTLKPFLYALALDRRILTAGLPGRGDGAHGAGRLAERSRGAGA